MSTGLFSGNSLSQSTVLLPPDRVEGIERGVATGRIQSVLYHNIFFPQCISLPSPSPVVPNIELPSLLISPEDRAFCQVGEV